MGLSQSQDQSRRFDKLTRVKLYYFFIFSIKLSRSDDPDHKFGRLTLVIFYVLFLIDFFFNLILQYGNGWGLKFITCFDLFFMRLSRFYNPDCKFGLLTRVIFY